jgi:uncharacterized membrane protein
MIKYTVLANQYDVEADAVADFTAVRKLYTDLKIVDTFDAAVISRTPDGKVKIVKRVEEPTRQGALRGLAVGAVIALFPGVGLGAMALGAATGALAGHVAGGMKRSDLKDLGELLDKGTSGLLVVTATDVEARVEAAIKLAKKRAKAELKADTKMLEKELEAVTA